MLICPSRRPLQLFSYPGGSPGVNCANTTNVVRSDYSINAGGDVANDQYFYGFPSTYAQADANYPFPNTVADGLNGISYLRAARLRWLTSPTGPATPIWPARSI